MSPQTNSSKQRALLIDADRESVGDVVGRIGRAGYAVTSAESLGEGRARLEEDFYHLVFIDSELPDGDGLTLLDTLRDGGSETIVLSAEGSVDQAVQAIKRGASEFLQKPVETKQLDSTLQKLSEKINLRNEVRELRQDLQELGAFGPLVGASPAMKEVYRLIEQVATTAASVLIVGDTGTGKELVANTVHRLSRRRDKPFVPINCGSLPGELIESELFGHEKGAFTGAVRSRRGVFERAHHGTLFLDEITELPLELQSTLLRVLETGEYARVGGEKIKRTDIRLISATNRDPEEAVAKGQLREDLLYRINLFPLQLPPLRDREGDIELLARHFLSILNKRGGMRRRWSNAAIEALESHSWPGNVRELENVVERSFIVAGDIIENVALPRQPGRPAAASSSDAPSIRPFVGHTIKEVEKELILATLEALGGNKKKAAETLGISLKTLYTRLNRYGS